MTEQKVSVAILASAICIVLIGQFSAWLFNVNWLFDAADYAQLKLIKLIVFSAVLLAVVMIRVGRDADAELSVYSSWHAVTILAIHALDGLLFSLFGDTALWIWLTISCLVSSVFVYCSFHFDFLIRRMADLLTLTSTAGLLFVLVGLFGYPQVFSVTDAMAMTQLIIASLAAGGLMAIGLMRTQHRGIQVTERELLVFMVALAGLTELWLGEAMQSWWSVAFVQVALIAALALLMVKLIKQSNRQLRLLNGAIERAEQGYFCMTDKWALLYVNEQYRNLFGIESHKAIKHLVQPFYAHPMRNRVEKHLKRKGYWRGQTVLALGNSGAVPVAVDMAMLKIGSDWFIHGWLNNIKAQLTFQEERNMIQQKLEQLSFNLIEKQEEERRYFAKELHDEIGQGLTLLKIQQQLPEPDKALITTVLAELIDKVRNLSLNLRPSILDDMGLVVALNWLADRQMKFSKLKVNCDIEPSIPRLNDKIEISIFRIAQEAFTNIHKYAHATNVELSCKLDGDYIVLNIADNGIGFDVNAKLNSAVKGQSLGLLGIQERGFLIDGFVNIESTPEQGTRIQLRVPIKGEQV